MENFHSWNQQTSSNCTFSLKLLITMQLCVMLKQYGNSPPASITILKSLMLVKMRPEQVWARLPRSTYWVNPWPQLEGDGREQTPPAVWTRKWRKSTRKTRQNVTNKKKKRESSRWIRGVSLWVSLVMSHLPDSNDWTLIRKLGSK